jgi:hypothetical protein
MFTLLLIFVVVVAVLAYTIGSRAARRPPQGAFRAQPGDGTQAGYRPQPGYGAQPGYGPQYGVPPAQPGMGGHIMGGLATGLAVGAGALAAQEIGRHVLGQQDQHGQQGIGSGADFHPAADSPLAHEAGIDSVDGGGQFGVADAGGWDDAGGFDLGGGDGGWDS